MPSIFSKVGTAKIRPDANWIRPCTFIAMITKCKIEQNRKKLDRCFVEMKVVRVVDPREHENGGNPHRVGEEVTKAFQPENDYFDSEILAFICCCAGVNPDSATEQERVDAATLVFGSENPLAGTFVLVEARTIMTKGDATKKPAPFTKVSFKREVAPNELAEWFADRQDEKKLLFPNDELDTLVAAQAA